MMMFKTVNGFRYRCFLAHTEAFEKYCKKKTAFNKGYKCNCLLHEEYPSQGDLYGLSALSIEMFKSGTFIILTEEKDEG